MGKCQNPSRKDSDGEDNTPAGAQAKQSALVTYTAGFCYANYYIFDQ